MTQDVAADARNRREVPGPGRIVAARLILLIERMSPVVVIAGAPIAAIIAISLFDGWRTTPQWAHAIALCAALLLAGSLAWRLSPPQFLPLRGEALARLERDGGVRHDALRVIEDEVFTGDGPLWDAHRAEMREEARRAALCAPELTANSVDPFGFRYAATALLVIGLIVAGADAPSRIARGFIPSDPRAAAPGFADLWIEPPAYTGKAPIYLLRGEDSLPGMRKAIEAPQGSIVHAQAPLRARLTLRAAGKTLQGEKDAAAKSGRLKIALIDDGLLTLSAGGRAGRWPIDVILDRAPEVSFVDNPASDDEGRLAFVATTDDDYGVASAALRLRLDAAQDRPLDAPQIGDDAKAESRLINVDGLAGPPAVRAVALDLDSDPWAGLRVIATLVVTDSAGQSAEAAPVKVTMPQKPFFNPLARAVIEQRQSLAVAPGEWRRAEWAFSGLTLGPEYFFDNPSEYLLLRTAMWRVSKEAGGDYRKTVEDFWPLALQLENESLELARQRLEAAKEALRMALENGADDNEIEKLTEAMRSALQQYLQALAQSGEQAPQDGPPADETLNAADLEQMLDSIRDLAKSGASAAARQALADLENLLNNLRMSNRGGRGGDGGREGGAEGGAVGQTGDLIGRQRELADRAFERAGQRGAQGDDLGEQQGALSADLSELIKSLEGAGEDSDPEGLANQSFQKALGAMRRSEQALRAEEFDSANEAMERAIASLREGAEELAEGEAQARQAGGGQTGAPVRDPLGRNVGEALGQDVDVPEKSDAQRTRELLEELRRRLSQGGRTDEEIKYLERLLQRF